jgi:tRNA (guanine-N7-)-methyltransferase
MSDTPIDPQFNRPIRSFVKREGKFTTGQQNAIDELWQSHGVDLGNEQIDLVELFGRDAPVVLEIGFGNGLSLAEMAKTHAEMNFFGIEVHKPGVGSCLVQAKKHGLSNIRVSGDDAVLVLNQQVADGTLERVQIFFPDPWHKKRHHKRRLIQPAFVETLIAKLKVGGQIHVATDWENYAEHVLAVLSANSDIVNTVADAPSAAHFLSSESELLTDSSLWADQTLLAQGSAEKPDYRPGTKYEARGIRLGHGVWDLVFEKKA